MILRGGLVLVLVACSSGAPRHLPATVPVAKRVVHRPAPSPPPFPRLPRNFTPSGYRARLAIGDQIGGHIEITGDLKESAPVIWLHGVGLDVASATATMGPTSVELDVAHTHWPNRPDELLALQPEHPLTPGRWVLSLEYTAPISEQALITAPGDMAHYHDSTQGAFREVFDATPYVFTQFEPMYARRVFPCIDEPDVKVPWQLTLDVAKDLIAASNTQIIRETVLDAGHKRVEFAPTLPLPSYLIAFAVGPFDIVDAGKAKSGVPIRVLVQKGAAANARVAVETTTRVLDALEDWFQIPYPYTKLDLVAVPQTGQAWGAMENPGLVTFNAQIGNPQFVGSVARRGWVQTVSHELAHQWFGDLVTPAWWNDIWLNESFARWMSTKITAQFDPSWDTSEYLEARVQAMSPGYPDGQPRSVRAPADAAETPELLAGYFSGARGSQLIRMLEAFIGPVAFQTAIRTYVRTHAHGNVASSDLMAAVSQVSNQALDPIFADFLDKSSTPDVTFELRCDRARRTLRLWSTPMETWTIPVCFAYDSDGVRAQQCVLLDQGAKEVSLAVKACPRWVMPNAGGAGLYRVKWSSASLTALIDYGWKALTPSERATVLSEPPEPRDEALLLSIAPKLIDAGDSASISTGIAILNADAKLVPSDLRKRFNDWVQQRLSPAARGVDLRSIDDDDATRRMQIGVIYLLAQTDDAVLLREASALASEYRSIDDNFLVPALSLAANADPQLAQHLFEEASTLKDRHLRQQILFALSDTSNGLDLFKQNPKTLQPLDEVARIMLLATTCDPSRRSIAIEIADKVLDKSGAAEVSTVIDECLASRKKLAPIFRAWLGPVSRP